MGEAVSIETLKLTGLRAFATCPSVAGCGALERQRRIEEERKAAEADGKPKWAWVGGKSVFPPAVYELQPAVGARP